MAGGSRPYRRLYGSLTVAGLIFGSVPGELNGVSSEREVNCCNGLGRSHVHDCGNCNNK